MLRQFAKDSVVYGIASILVRAINFLLLPIYARILSPGQIGSLDLLAVAIGIAHVTVALEVAQGLARHFPDAADEESRRRLATSAFGFTVLSYSAFVAIGLLGAPLFSQVFLNGGSEAAVRLAVLAAWFGGLLQLLLTEFRFQHRSRAFALITIVSVSTSILVSVALVVFARLGVEGAIAGQAVGTAIALIVALRHRRYGLAFKTNGAELRAMLRFSPPLVPSSVGVVVLISIDRIVISQAMTLDDVGTFGVAYRLAQIVGIAMAGVQLALMPLVYQRHRDPETPAELARIFRLFVAGAVVIWVGLSAFAQPLVALIATDRYAASAALISVLIPAIVLANAYVFAPGLSVGMRTGLIALTSLGAAALNTALNVLLVPTFGLLGAATATLTASGALFVVTMMLSQREYRIPYDWRRISVVTGITAVLVAVVQLSPRAGLMSEALGVTAILLVVSSCIAFGLLRRSEIAVVVAGVRGWRAT